MYFSIYRNPLGRIFSKKETNSKFRLSAILYRNNIFIEVILIEKRASPSFHPTLLQNSIMKCFCNLYIDTYACLNFVIQSCIIGRIDTRFIILCVSKVYFTMLLTKLNSSRKKHWKSLESLSNNYFFLRSFDFFTNRYHR